MTRDGAHSLLRVRVAVATQPLLWASTGIDFTGLMAQLQIHLSPFWRTTLRPFLNYGFLRVIASLATRFLLLMSDDYRQT